MQGCPRARFVAAFALAIATAALACHRSSAPPGESPAIGSLASPPATSVASAPDDGQWLMAAKDYANTRYSGLQEITTANVTSLRPTWTFSTGVLRGQEAAPLIVNGTMFIVTPYPNIVDARDLTKPGAPVKASMRSAGRVYLAGHLPNTPTNMQQWIRHPRAN